MGTSDPRPVTLRFDRPVSDAEIRRLREACGASAAIRLPQRVLDSLRLAAETGFAASSTPEVGQLLAVLAAGVPPGGRILELGTGTGAGLGWILHGLGPRTDVTVTSVESDARRAESVRNLSWPSWVSIVTGDGWDLAGAPGPFDLVFVDLPGKARYDLAAVVAVLRGGGVLVIDDVGPAAEAAAGPAGRLGGLRDRLFGDGELVAAELTFSSGVLIATRRR